MRIFIPVAVLIALFGAYWWFWQDAAQQVREEVHGWVAEERAAGRIADYSEMRIHGFPYRMQVEITNPRLGDPEMGWSWQTEQLTGFVLPYRLNHMVIVASGPERLELTRLDRFEVVTGEPASHRASIVLRDGDLERFDFDLDGFALTRTIHFLDGTVERVEDIAGENIQFHSRRLRDLEGVPDTGDHHAVVFEATNLLWDNHPYEGLGPNLSAVLARVIVTGLPESGIGSVNTELLRGWHANEGEFYLDEFALQWGDIEFYAQGEMHLDRRNRPRGRATVLVGGHDELIDAMVAGGAVPGEYAELAKSALDVVATLGGDPEGRIRARLRMEGGKLLIGPIEVMDLPPLYREREPEAAE